MIKLFRKIRQKLLSENKFSKYLIYAIGEIVLVVIGILIALQVNNLNEQSKLNKQEKQVLNNLKQDFKHNHVEINKVLFDNKATIDSAFVILNNTGNKYKEGFSINNMLGDVTGTIHFYPKNGFLNDLINSGNLGIIKSNRLRNLLSSWLPTLEDLSIREKSAKEFESKIIQYVIENGSWLSVDQVDDDETIKKLKFPHSGFDVNNNELLQSVEFENMVENQIVFIELVNERLELCLALNREIQKMIENEIKE